MGWIVAVQVIAWIVGDVVFSWLPFKTWVKAADQVRPVVQPLPADWAAVVEGWRRVTRQRARAR